MCQTSGCPLRPKVTFNVSSSDPSFESELQLSVRINTMTVQGTHKGEEFNVTYNTCTSSDDPDMFCKEAQVSFSKTVKMFNISYHLYRKSGMHDTKLHSFLLELQECEGLFCTESACMQYSPFKLCYNSCWISYMQELGIFLLNQVHTLILCQWPG